MKFKELGRYHMGSSRQIQTIAKEKNRIPLASLVLGQQVTSSRAE
jgi:hypothetical protein